MKKRIGSGLLVLGFLLIGAVLLIGCQAAKLPEAEASGEELTGSGLSEAAAAIAPADRKFYNRGYLYGWNGSQEQAGEARIHPADIKFYNSERLSNIELQELSTTMHPADRKFYNRGHLYGWRGLQEEAGEAWTHPADIKFFNSTYFKEIDLQEFSKSLHPADRKFLNLDELR